MIMGTFEKSAEKSARRPPQKRERDSESLLRRFRDLLRDNPGQLVLQGPGGETAAVPAEIEKIIRTVAGGDDAVLTTQQAADYLKVSRSTMLRLLEKGNIPFTRVGGTGHRRLRLADVQAWDEETRLRREKAAHKRWQELVAFVAEPEVSPEEAVAAVKRVREKRRL